jgi:hypothetical protein
MRNPQGILNLMPRRRSLVLLAGLFCVTALIGCGTPPTREMDQAQGAIDTARAAGADRYASEQYQAAVKALQSAHDAVAARDYRLALNHALDSRDRAQRAAKEGASQQVTLRSSAERQLAQVAATLDQAKQRLTAADAARVPKRTLAAPRAAIEEAEASLQKAGTGIQDGEYQVSQNRLAESAKKLQAAMAEIDSAMKPRGQRPRR